MTIARLAGSGILMLMFALAAVSALADGNPFIVDYPFETAVIEYEITGTNTGRETLYIDHGRKALWQVSTTSVMGVSTERRTLEVTTPDRVIVADLVEKTATSKPNMAPLLYDEWSRLPPGEQANVAKTYRRLGFEVTKLFGGKRARESRGMYLGKPVIIASNELLTLYTWEGLDIVLLSDATLLGVHQVRKATRIETNVALPAKAFDLPDGIEVKEDEKADEESRQLARTMIESLRELDQSG